MVLSSCCQMAAETNRPARGRKSPDPTMTYALLNKFNKSHSAYGSIISLHTSPEAAAEFNHGYQRKIKKGHGSSAYIPTSIQLLKEGQWKPGDNVCDDDIIEILPEGY